MRDRANTEEDRLQLQRKLALLQRDTSGKSDVAIAGLEKELQSMNQTLYDQRQDDFAESEEKALLAAQEVLQDEIELQTAVLTMMNDNVQLIQETVDAIMNSGPENLAQFLSNWSQEYANSTPTNQTAMNENFANLSGQVRGYIEYLAGSMTAAVQALNEGSTAAQIAPPDYNLGTPSGGGGSSPPAPPAPAKRYRVTYTVKDTRDNMPVDGGSGIGGSASSARSVAESYAQKKLTSTYYRAYYDKAVAFKSGGLVNYTGPAIVHGSKSKPEAVLNPRQTSTFQKFTNILDSAFGSNMRAKMVKQHVAPLEQGQGRPTVVVEKHNINIWRNSQRLRCSSRGRLSKRRNSENR